MNLSSSRKLNALKNLRSLVNLITVRRTMRIIPFPTWRGVREPQRFSRKEISTSIIDTRIEDGRNGRTLVLSPSSKLGIFFDWDLCHCPYRLPCPQVVAISYLVAPLGMVALEWSSGLSAHGVDRRRVAPKDDRLLQAAQIPPPWPARLGPHLRKAEGRAR